MPYASKRQLPSRVRDNLPSHAQDIYRKAYNDAYDRYSDPSDRRGEVSREETAWRVAWSAVKRKYRKDGGEWHER